MSVQTSDCDCWKWQGTGRHTAEMDGAGVQVFRGRQITRRHEQSSLDQPCGWAIRAFRSQQATKAVRNDVGRPFLSKDLFKAPRPGFNLGQFPIILLTNRLSASSLSQNRCQCPSSDPFKPGKIKVSVIWFLRLWHAVNSGSDAAAAPMRISLLKFRICAHAGHVVSDSPCHRFPKSQRRQDRTCFQLASHNLKAVEMSQLTHHVLTSTGENPVSRLPKRRDSIIL